MWLLQVQVMANLSPPVVRTSVATPIWFDSPERSHIQTVKESVEHSHKSRRFFWSLYQKMFKTVSYRCAQDLQPQYFSFILAPIDKQLLVPELRDPLAYASMNDVSSTAVGTGHFCQHFLGICCKARGCAARWRTFRWSNNILQGFFNLSASYGMLHVGFPSTIGIQPKKRPTTDTTQARALELAIIVAWIGRWLVE